MALKINEPRKKIIYTVPSAGVKNEVFEVRKKNSDESILLELETNSLKKNLMIIKKWTYDKRIF